MILSSTQFLMSSFLRKILVLLPVVLLGIFFFYDHYETYKHVRQSRLIFLLITFLVFYGLIFLEVSFRNQNTFFAIATQSSFYVYIFMVLTLTGYFILFREVSAHDWWHKMMVRIDKKDHVNFHLFKIFHIYKLVSTQIIGNFFMLFPLGIYLPLLYKRCSNIFLVFLISMLTSALIETLQLVTTVRSADVDDVFLNTLGACAGFIFFKVIIYFFRVISSQNNVSLTLNKVA